MTAGPHEVTVADRLAAALPGPVERRETHGAWVLLRGDRALKLRKPVRLPFLDYSTPEARRAAAEAEVRLNAPLAPSVYLGVRALVDGPDGLRLADADADGAIDYAVEMRRFDERCTMAALARAGRLSTEEIDAAGAVLARFHASASRCGGDAAQTLADRVAADLDELAAFDPAGAARRRGYADGALREHGPELDRRAAAGLRRDGHGDLRAEHVVFGERLLVVDRLEFDPALRCGDVAGDLAFLTMDLEALGQRWAAERVVDAYRHVGGDPGGARLRALLAWQRAIVRAKVARIRGAEEEAGALLDLADALAWRDRAPRLLLVMGPPASGKSTLASRLARLTELPVIATDVTRKAMHGRGPTDRLKASAYADDVTTAVYRRVGEAAATAVAEHGGAIVDATARTRVLRAQLLAALAGVRPAVAVCCEASAATRRARALARERDPGRISDADAAVADALGTDLEPLAGDEPLDLAVAVRTDDPARDPVAALAAAIDAQRAGR